LAKLKVKGYGGSLCACVIRNTLYVLGTAIEGFGKKSLSVHLLLVGVATMGTTKYKEING
jgi:hypothetical protein